MATNTNAAPEKPADARRAAKEYVGTIVGESTTREFRIAVAQESVREQDIIAVDAELHPSGKGSIPERYRVWAKVQRIERLNPLFPSEAGHELAETRTDPFDTVLSLSREMVTAVCQVLGVEPEEGDARGKLAQLRYPPKPAASTYMPDADDLHRVIQGALREKEHRSLDLAHLANRREIDVRVDGHAVVSRHLAILAMTGAGKSWAARRLVEQIATKKYPMVIFDPHGDYSGLADVPELRGRVDRYFATFPIFDEDAATVAGLVSSLGYKLSDTMATLFDDLFAATKAFWSEDVEERTERSQWLSSWLEKPTIEKFGIKQDLFLLADVAQAADRALTKKNDEIRDQLGEMCCWTDLKNYSKVEANTLVAIMKRTRRAAAVLQRMEATNRKVALRDARALPQDRTSIVQDGRVSVVSLAGYTGDFQATIYSIIANEIFDARVQGELRWPALLVLEEAHNFVPGKPLTEADTRSIAVTKQIAQEGRKFGVGLVLISQRPSRLDETTLSQCNSYIILRMVNPADQAFVRKVVESLTEDEAHLLPSLDVGEALFSGQFVNFPVLVKIKEPKSKGEREEVDAFVKLDEVRSAVAAEAARRPVAH